MSYVGEQVRKDSSDREAVGLKKYGVSLDRKDLTPMQWLQHFYEELLDGAHYAKAWIIGEAEPERLTDAELQALKEYHYERYERLKRLQAARIAGR